MSIALLPRGNGTRRADDRIAEVEARADSRVAELEARIRRLEADKQALAKANEQLAHDLTRSILRASQDAMWRAQADEENTRLKARVRDLGNKVIRAGAEHARLRQAVINARPRIREVPTDLVRPYSPIVQLPYTSPVPWRDTSTDQTQQLPVLDWPTHPAT